MTRFARYVKIPLFDFLYLVRLDISGLEVDEAIPPFGYKLEL